MATTVVNVRSLGNGHYSGIWIDRKSVFGNPYHIGKDGTREECIEKYRAYFHRRLETDAIFASMIDKLRNCTLICWCKPQACHGDVIVEYLDKVKV